MSNNEPSFNTLHNMAPKDLLNWLNETYMFQIPTTLENVDDLKDAGILLGKLTNIYSYLMSMATFAKLAVRESRKRKLPKEVIDDCIDRRDVIDNYTDIIKTQYTAVSRMITVKKQIDDELKMI